MTDLLFALRDAGIISPDHLVGMLSGFGIAPGELPIKSLLALEGGAKPAAEDPRSPFASIRSEATGADVKPIIPRSGPLDAAEEEKRAEMRVKGLLKTYITGERTQSIHQYWDIFGKNRTLRKKLIPVLLYECVRLDPLLPSGKASVVSLAAEYVATLTDRMVLSIPEVLAQTSEVLRKIQAATSAEQEIVSKIAEEVLKLTILKWDCTIDLSRTLDFFAGAGEEREDTVKMKLGIVTRVLRLLRAKKTGSAETEIRGVRKCLSGKGINLAYFDSELE